MMRLPFRRMKWIRLLAGALASIGLVAPAMAQSNYTQSSVYLNNDSVAITTSYTDGFGREIQTRTELGGTKGLIVGSSVDLANRLTKVSVPFTVNTAGYYAGDAPAQACTQRGSETEAGNIAYASFSYKSGPSSRTDRVTSPGVPYSSNPHRTWYMGTLLNNTTDADIDLNGFASSGFVNGATDAAFDVLEATLNDNSAGRTAYYKTTHTLTITKGPNPGDYFQVVKDAFGFPIKTCAMNDIMAEYVYDGLGRTLKELPPHPTSPRMADPLNATEYTYNTLGELTYKKSPNAGEMRFGYDKAGRVWVAQDARQRAKSATTYTVFVYDIFGRIVAVGLNKTTAVFDDNNPTKAWPTTIAGIFPRVKLYFDTTTTLIAETGLTSAEVSAMGLTNTAGRLVADLSFDEGADAVVYNTDNEYWAHVVLRIYSYNANGQVDSAFIRTPKMVDFDKFEFTYDRIGNPLTETYRSPYTASAPLAVKNVNYDRFGRPVAVYGNNSYKLVEYKYDDYGRMTQKKYRNHRVNADVDVVNYSYNIMDWLKGISSSTLGAFSEVLTHADITEDANVKRIYDGGISSAAYAQKNESNGPVSESNKYLYDQVNRLVKVTSSNAAYNEAFGYGRDGRIAFNRKAGATSGNEYYYTPTGNHQVRTIAAPLNRSYIYDANGNRIWDSSKLMVTYYDWRNMAYKHKLYTLNSGQTVPSMSGLVKPEAIEAALVGKCTLRSEVKSIYDASAFRVAKLTYGR